MRRLRIDEKLIDGQTPIFGEGAKIDAELDDREQVERFFRSHGVRDVRPSNYDEAFSRSKQFLQARGYKVEEDGLARLPVPLTEKDAAALISALVILPIPAFVSLIDTPVRAIFEDDAGAAPWSLWLVAELKTGPHSGHKLVFDEHTRHFGVASPKGAFLGFWGSFRQTLEALCGT